MNQPKAPTLQIVENILLSSRYLLVPMYVGLIGAMLLYDFAFMRELWAMGRDFWHAENAREFVLLGTLGLVDASMVANLISMVILGSHNVFVSEFKHTEGVTLPRVLKGLTGGLLKVKMGQSVVSVSTIHLLTIFMNIDKTSWADLSKRLAIHGMFILSAWVFTKIECSLHPPHNEPSEKPEAHS